VQKYALVIKFGQNCKKQTKADCFQQAKLHLPKLSMWSNLPQRSKQTAATFAKTGKKIPCFHLIWAKLPKRAKTECFHQQKEEKRCYYSNCLYTTSQNRFFLTPFAAFAHINKNTLIS